MANLKVQNNLTVNGDIINNKMDYQLDQSISVTEQNAICIPVDFSNYDYKLCMRLSVYHKTQTTAHNICIFACDAGVLRNSSARWVYTGVTAHEGNVNPGIANYCAQTQSNGYIYLIDNENNKARYNRINVELYHTSGTTIDYQSTASRAYASNFEYKNASGLLYDDGYNTLPQQLCIFNGDQDWNQYLNGNIRVYKRPKFNANSALQSIGEI